MRLFQALVAVLAFAATARADVKLHPLFTDNMVLQQGVEVPVWGKADPAEIVHIEFTAPITDQDDLKHFTKWEEASPDNVGPFSAALYHFGNHLQKNLNVPVGVIHTSWGGTPAEAWTSIEALEAEPELKHYADNAKKA